MVDRGVSSSLLPTYFVVIKKEHFSIHFDLAITINLSDNHYQYLKSSTVCFDSCDSNSLNFWARF